MDKKLIGTFFSFLWLVIACESVHEVRLPVLPPQLVMNMILQPDSLLKVNLSRTVQDLGNHYYTQDTAYFNSFFVNNGKITLWKNGEELGELQKAEGRGDYIWPEYSFSPGDRITLQAEAPEYETIEGETLIPYPSPILEVDIQSGRISEQWGEQICDIKLDLRFQDQPGVKNYYMLSLNNRIKYDHHGEESFFYGSRGEIIHEEDLLFEHEGYFRFSNSMYINYYQWHRIYSFLFTDETIEGKEVWLNFQIKNAPSSFYSDTLTLENTWTLEFYTLSESYYLYFRSKALQYDQEDFFWDLGMREPMPTYTNVRGGYGLVSALQYDSFEFTTPETDQPPVYTYAPDY